MVQTALRILPVLMHLVQTYLRTCRLFSITVMRFTFGRHIFFVFLFEWLTLLPIWIDFPQTSHFAMAYSFSADWAEDPSPAVVLLQWRHLSRLSLFFKHFLMTI